MSQDATTETKIRLLRCDVCRSLEEIPDFDGPPDYDVILQVTLSRHKHPSGEPHVGRLIDVPEKAWNIPPLREALLRQIHEGSRGLNEFDPAYYDVQDTFREDALLCYSQHLRPKEGCPDWHADNKRLMPDTKGDRKELGLSPKGMPVIFLCSFCPVRSYMERKSNEEQGIV